MENQAVLKKNTNKFTTKELVLIAMFAAVMAVCSWISIPIGAIPVTLQTFGVFCALSLLGGRNGSFSIAVYILLGAIGLPVFTGFKGGLAALTGPTGGYILGFILMALLYWAGTKLFGSKLPVSIGLLTAGLAVCYLFGTIWFVDWRMALIATVLFLILLFTVKYMSVCACVSSLSCPVILAILGAESPVVLVLSTLSALLVVARHKENFKRLFERQAKIHRGYDLRPFSSKKLCSV